MDLGIFGKSVINTPETEYRSIQLQFRSLQFPRLLAN